MNSRNPFLSLPPRHSSTLIAALALLLTANSSVFAKSNPPRWEKEIAAFEAEDAKQMPPKNAVLFIGSSSIRMWSTLQKDFPQHQVINRGFGGSQIADATHFADRIIFPYDPRMIVLYSGGNDINAGASAEDVFADYKTFVARVREKLPEVEIAYISVAGNPARWKDVEKVKTANAKIEEFTKQDPKLKFINVFDEMLGEDGQPKPDIFLPDRLHMNPEGYKIWTRVVAPHLPAADR